MEIDIRTHEIFIEHKCGLVHMTQEEHLYDSLSENLIFFYPKYNKMILHKIIGTDNEKNLPIVDTKSNESEWTVNNNEELEMALDLMFVDTQ